MLEINEWDTINIYCDSSLDIIRVRYITLQIVCKNELPIDTKIASNFNHWVVPPYKADLLDHCSGQACTGLHQ